MEPHYYFLHYHPSFRSSIVFQGWGYRRYVFVFLTMFQENGDIAQGSSGIDL